MRNFDRLSEPELPGPLDRQFPYWILAGPNALPGYAGRLSFAEFDKATAVSLRTAINCATLSGLVRT